MIQDNVGDALDVVMSGHGDDGHREVEIPGGVDGDETVDGAFQKHARILVDEIGAMAVAGDKVEIALLQEVIFDAAHDGSGIAVADLGDNDTDGKTALGAERAGKEIGTIFEFAGGSEDSVFGGLRDGIGDARAIDDQGDGGRGKCEVLRQLFQAHGFAGGACGSIGARLGGSGGHGAESRTLTARRQAEILIRRCLYY